MLSFLSSSSCFFLLPDDGTVLSGRDMKTLKRYGKKFNNSKKFINKRVKINNFIHEFGFPFSQSKSITRFLEMLNFKLEFSSVFKPLLNFYQLLNQRKINKSISEIFSCVYEYFQMQM